MNVGRRLVQVDVSPEGSPKRYRVDSTDSDHAGAEPSTRGTFLGRGPRCHGAPSNGSTVESSAMYPAARQAKMSRSSRRRRTGLVEATPANR